MYLKEHIILDDKECGMPERIIEKRKIRSTALGDKRKAKKQHVSKEVTEETVLNLEQEIVRSTEHYNNIVHLLKLVDV